MTGTPIERFTTSQIRGYRNQIAGAARACDNGAEVTLHLHTVNQLVKVLDFLMVERKRKGKDETPPAKVCMDEERRDYHLSEILGCADEFRNMPCGSLRDRLNQSIDRALACEHAAERKAKRQQPETGETQGEA